ncbi:hypothetical protein M0R45_002463 [Rubus argutus]|uniref:Uncharacterized protein n=1 Tax=Rubus argutus TaxID=59490 RepID=A0AAW1VP37_RUBAR
MGSKVRGLDWPRGDTNVGGREVQRSQSSITSGAKLWARRRRGLGYGGGEAEMGFDSLGSEFQLDQRRDAGLLRSMTSTVTGAWGSQDEAGKGEHRLLGS